MKKIFSSITLITFSVTIFSFDLPSGWFKAGSDPSKYEMGVDKGAGQDGKNAATIQSNEKNINGFGTLMQNCLPDQYLGKRIKVSGYMKSQDVKSWAGFWLRVDDTNSKQPLSFDNMQDRSIKGTTEWKKYEIVLDVPASASNIAYGALISGSGKIWFDNLSFEIVDNTIPTTGMSTSGGNKKSSPDSPTNLDFEK
jgi:hypothetical protein